MGVLRRTEITAFVVPNFQGLAPRYADRLLDDSQASFATNIKVGNGDLRGFRSLVSEGFLTPTGVVYRRAIKIYRTNSDEFTYFTSTDINASALKSPLATDAFDRIYFTDNTSTGLRVITYAELATDVPSSSSGIVRPASAPNVSPPAGTDDIRAYVYTYVDRFGAIGPPSPTTIAQGNLGTWVISGFTVAPANAVKIFIYRSATGEQTSGAYYKVGEIASTVGSFNDSMPPDQVPLQPILDSFDNDPAPENVQGLILHSSGAFAAFHDRTVYFSTPYLPHSWPQAYAYTVSDVIVGIAPLLNSVVVLTKGVPFILSGNHPAQMAIQKLPDPEPCTSQRSIVVMSNAVMFCSTNGLCSISANGLTRPTNALLTREEFIAYFPEAIFAASYGSYYIAFYEPSRGFAIALPPFEPISFMPLDRYFGVTGLDTDPRSGDLMVIQDDLISKFDARLDARFSTTFRSKEFIHTKPLNLGAVQILFKQVENEDDLDQLLLAMQAYNDSRMAFGPLDVFDGYDFNRQISRPDVIPALSGLPPIQPIGGEPLYDTTALFSFNNIQFTLLTDGQVKYTKIITDEKVHSLPEGYKATRFYLEVSGSAEVQRIIVAETRRECKIA